MNNITLIGRLTKAPELRYTSSNIAVATFTLAVDRGFKNSNGEKETDFIDIVVWRKPAENCANYLDKGRMVAVNGRLQIRSYETEDGQKRRIAEVVAEQVEFLSSGQNRSEEKEPDVNKTQKEEDIPGFTPMFDDEDLPF